MRHFVYVLLVMFFGSACIPKSKIDVQLAGNSKNAKASFQVNNVQVVNNQVVLTGVNLNSIQNISARDSGVRIQLQIDSSTSTSLIASARSNLMFSTGKIIEFIFTNSYATSTYTINFSLCDSVLGGKGFDCNAVPTDKQVLSYDATSDKWIPRTVNGLNYLGSFDASSGNAPVIQPSGSYYIISVAGTISGVYFEIGDWIVSNGSNYQKIDNSTTIVSVFGRTGEVTANLDDLDDVLITTPIIGQVLKFDGTNWVNAVNTFTESDPLVLPFAKAALPTCGVGQVLKSDGTVFSCVTDNTGAGAFSGTADRVVVTNGTGALSTSSVTVPSLNYLSNVTSDIQAQINSKLNSSTYVDWAVSGIGTIEPTRLNFVTPNRVIVSNASSNPVASSISSTELGFLAGVSSNIQTQLNSKISIETDPSVSSFAKIALPICTVGEVLKSNGTIFSCVTDNIGAGAYTGTQNRLVVTDGATGALSTLMVTNTEASYLSGVTSSIQTQLNSKQNIIGIASSLGAGSLTTNLRNGVNLSPYGASGGQTGELRFHELTTNGSNYTSFKAPDLLATDLNYILPSLAPTAGQVLSSSAAGVLSWISIPSAPVTTVFGRSGVVSATAGDYTATQITNTPAGSIAGITVQAAINELDSEKQGLITAGTTAQYYRGDKTFVDFGTDVRATALTGYTVGTGIKPAVVNTDTVTGAFGKVQKTLNDINADYVSKTTNQTINGALAINSATGFITVPNPINPNDAANKAYVDSYGQWLENGTSIYYNGGNVGIGNSTPLEKLVVGGVIHSSTGGIKFPDGSIQVSAATSIPSTLSFVQQARVATTGNITLSGLQTIDGVTLNAGDRVLVKDQSASALNGIYIASAGGWMRASDFDTWIEGVSYVAKIYEGSRNGGILFSSIMPITGILNTNSIKWSASGSSPSTVGNTVLGVDALALLTEGGGSVAIGDGALAKSTAAYSNTAIGGIALNENTTGSYNTAVSYMALRYNTIGFSNVSVGNQSLTNNTSGNKNVAIGVSALSAGKTKHESTAVGFESMKNADNSAIANSISYNTAVGAYSLLGSATPSANTGTKNTGIGHSSLYNLSSGSGNIGIGYNAGGAITTGSNNVIIGSNDGASIATSSNNIIISDGAGYERVRVNGTGVGLNTISPLGKLDISWGGENGLVGGADPFSFSRTNNNAKWFSYTQAQYSNANAPFLAIFTGSTNTENLVSIGGGNSAVPNATVLRFFTGASQSTNGAALERMTINSLGNIGIGVSSPTYQLQLSTDSAAKPGTSTWTIASDIRLKEIIKPFTRGLSEILNIDTYYFKYKKGNTLKLPSDQEYVGIKAQEIKKNIPEAVSIDTYGYLHVTNDSIIWAAINAIKEVYYKVLANERELIAVNEMLNDKVNYNELEKIKKENEVMKKYLCKKDPSFELCPR